MTIRPDWRSPARCNLAKHGRSGILQGTTNDAPGGGSATTALLAVVPTAPITKIALDEDSGHEHAVIPNLPFSRARRR